VSVCVCACVFVCVYKHEYSDVLNSEQEYLYNYILFFYFLNKR
jgi:hypothetical protein